MTKKEKNYDSMKLFKQIQADFMNSLMDKTLSELCESLQLPLNRIDDINNFAYALNHMIFCAVMTNNSFLNLPILKHIFHQGTHYFVFSRSIIGSCEDCHLTYYMNHCVCIGDGTYGFGNVSDFDNEDSVVIDGSEFHVFTDIIPFLSECMMEVGSNLKPPCI